MSMGVSSPLLIRVSIHPLNDAVPEPVFTSSIHSSAVERSLPLQKISERTIFAAARANGMHNKHAAITMIKRSLGIKGWSVSVAMQFLQERTLLFGVISLSL